jgi:hypothetical protein
MRHLSRAAALTSRGRAPTVVFGLLLAFGAGCPDSETGAGAPVVDELAYDCTHLPPGQTTVASDESFRAITDAEDATGLVTDEARAPTLLSPAAGTALSAGAPTRFELKPTLAQAGAGQTAPRAGGTALARAWAPRPTPHGLFARTLRWLNPIGVAHAHCPAVTGDNFLFRLEVGGKAVYTALLSVTTFTPDAGKWKAALQGHVGAEASLTLARAYLLQGRVIEGPYVGGTRPSFRIDP